MSWVSEVKDICGDYYIDIKYHEGQKRAITLFFNSRRNAETVKRCIELDDSVPNVATAVDFVEVVRCNDCKHCKCIRDTSVGQATWHCSKAYGLPDVDPTDYCSYGERSKNGT